MPQDKFMIAPLIGGVQNNVRPWLIPDNAFARLKNAYVFRGRVRKRFGSNYIIGPTDAQTQQLGSRLRINVGTTVGGALAANVRTVTGAAAMATSIGQAFSIENSVGTRAATMFTVFNATAGVQQMLRTDASASAATYNLTTSAFNITDVRNSDGSLVPDGTVVYFYPALPVMGLPTQQRPEINNERTIAFDTTFAYRRINDGWERMADEAVAGDAVWTGSDAQFFWATNWRANPNQSYLFVSNFNNQLRFLNGTTWNSFTPVYNDAGDTIVTARCIAFFKNRLILFNTVENIAAVSSPFPNRIRYSANGSIDQATSWNVDVFNQGGFNDAPTSEQIISVQSLKDRIIVFFENSTYELVWTQNEVAPFRFQKINRELGVESTFSIVPFDKVVMGVGNVGIHVCDGMGVRRIDDLIPDEVFNIHNASDGIARVYGIRDYVTEMVYWTLPSDNAPTKFPNRVLTFNYKTTTWGMNDDSITCFGYLSNANTTTWEMLLGTWAQLLDEWNAGFLQSEFRDVLAGNQEGYTFVVNPNLTRNAGVVQVTNVILVATVVTITAVNHNLANNDYVYFETIVGDADTEILNGRVYQITKLTANTFSIIEPGYLGGDYFGGGTITRVSQIDILTKQYNFYADKGLNMALSKIEFMVDKTEKGAIQVDTYASSSNESLTVTGPLLGTSVLETVPYDLYPLEQSQVRLWHPVYVQGQGECIQLEIYFNDEQMRNTDISLSDFQLHAMTFFGQPTGRLQ